MGTFPGTCHVPKILRPSMKSGANTYPKAEDTLDSFIQSIFRPAFRSSVFL